MKDSPEWLAKLLVHALPSRLEETFRKLNLLG